ncbi:VanZ family protein [Paenibacillus gorillae]|uniref:VanZ family protein n=1 Tax=Paenibacillus gorillae TaxID=1243662 RepID=UPI001EE2D156|nr:VanZ family protein [Paenibacillus gorillae]
MLFYYCIASGLVRLILFFVLSITIVETLQMITRLGAFDIDDIIINTMGAAVGFWAQRFVTRNRDTFKGFVKIVLTSVVLAIGVIVIIGGINEYLTKGGGEVAALE